MSSSIQLDHIPENLPPRAVTSQGAAWPPVDSADAPWGEAHITVTGGEIMFAEQTLENLPLLEMRPQRSIEWFEVDAIVDTHFENGWRCLVLAGTDGDHVYATLIPWAHFLPAPDSNDAVDPFLVALATEVASVAEDDDVLTYPGNLDRLLSYAHPTGK